MPGSSPGMTSILTTGKKVGQREAGRLPPKLGWSRLFGSGPDLACAVLGRDNAELTSHIGQCFDDLLELRRAMRRADRATEEGGAARGRRRQRQVHIDTVLEQAVPRHRGELRAIDVNGDDR